MLVEQCFFHVFQRVGRERKFHEHFHGARARRTGGINVENLQRTGRMGVFAKRSSHAGLVGSFGTHVGGLCGQCPQRFSLFHFGGTTTDAPLENDSGKFVAVLHQSRQRSPGGREKQFQTSMGQFQPRKNRREPKTNGIQSLFVYHMFFSFLDFGAS